jgi:hypothetical protein
MVQKHWSDNSVSVTVYYSKDELDKLKTWLRDNLSELKTISFLCHDDHGFLQAPYEPITEEEYNTMANSLKPLSLKNLKAGQDVEVDDCAGGSCPIK